MEQQEEETNAKYVGFFFTLFFSVLFIFEKVQWLFHESEKQRTIADMEALL